MLDAVISGLLAVQLSAAMLFGALYPWACTRGEDAARGALRLSLGAFAMACVTVAIGSIGVLLRLALGGAS